MSQALLGPPWAIMGLALVGSRGLPWAGPLWAPLGPHGPRLVNAFGHVWAEHLWGPLGPHGPQIPALAHWAQT